MEIPNNFRTVYYGLGLDEGPFSFLVNIYTKKKEYNVLKRVCYSITELY